MGANQDTRSTDSARATDVDEQSPVSWLGPLGARRGDDGRFTRAQVWLKVTAIVLFVIVATVWFPSYIMEPNSLAIPRDLYAGLLSAGAWDTVLSLISSGAWFVALAFAFWALRKTQKSQTI